MAAMAEHRERAVKVAGQLLKANKITIDALPKKVEELAKATPEVLQDYETFLRQAKETNGMTRQASADAPDTIPIVQKSANRDNKNNLVDSIQSLFRLDQRNKEYERYSED